MLTMTPYAHKRDHVHVPVLNHYKMIPVGSKKLLYLDDIVGCKIKLIKSLIN